MDLALPGKSFSRVPGAQPHDMLKVFVYAAAGVVLLLIAWLYSRREGDLPPGYGTPGNARADRRRWAVISLLGGVAFLAFSIVAFVSER
jgi:hypothetical protein